jgi:hypothetical protein
MVLWVVVGETIGSGACAPDVSVTVLRLRSPRERSGICIRE